MVIFLGALKRDYLFILVAIALTLLLAGCGGGGGGGGAPATPPPPPPITEPIEVVAVLTPTSGGAKPITVSLAIPIDSRIEPLTVAVQIPPSGRLIEALMATVVIMPPDDPAHSVTARVIIPSGGSAPAATSTLVIPVGGVPAAPAAPGTVLLIPPDTAGGEVLTASIMFSPFDGMGRITLTVTAPALPRLMPATIHAYAQALPQTYFYASLTVDAASLAVSLYTMQLHYGITLVGAHRLHWSRLKPLGEISGEEIGERSSRYIRGAGVTVGVVDSGIDIDHPDLQDNILTITGHGVRMENIEDKDGHGTRVAGIIAARLNADGVVGVAPEAKLLAVHFIEEPEATQVSLTTAYNYMTANNAFVVNNSWGFPERVVLVSVGANALYDIGSGSFSGPGRYWLSMPRQFYLDTTDRGTSAVPWLVFPGKIIDFRSSFDAFLRIAARTPPEEAMLLVFAAGNGGWNSETGEVPYCPEPSGRTCSPGAVNISLSNFNTLTVYGEARYKIEGDEPGNYTITLRSINRNIQGGSVTVSISKNELDMVARMPVDYPEVASIWINVVNVDSEKRIHWTSNGCGVTQKRCLAAPGSNITTTALGGKTTTVGIYGTSFAAPHVSGAAALLKGAFPNLTPQQVGHILLESADGMGKCEDVDKKISCFEPVYGHGILNITAAFTPTSFIGFAADTSVPDSSRGDSGTAVRDGFNIAASRIQLSPAFGAAPWRRESLALGGVDNYGRVFYTHLDLSGGVYVSKPLIGEDQEVKGAAVHRAYAPPLSQPLAAATYIAADELASAQWRQSSAGVSYGGAQSPHRQSHFISSHLGSSRLGWHTRSGNGGLASSSAGYWQAPFDSGSVHQLQWDYPLAPPSAPQVGVMLGGGDGVRQTAARLQWQWSDWALSAEGGVVREDSRVLGASFTGGFSLKGTETRYRRLRGVYQSADGLRLFAGYVQSDSAADGDGGIVRRLDARADAWQAGLSYGRWRFIVSQPLVVTSGGLDLSYISGYTAAGDYAVTRKRLDLSSGRRARRASLLYEREAIDGLGFVLGLDVWRHAPLRGYAGDAVAVSGALRYRF